MRTAKQYAEVTRLNLRPEIEYCPFCQCYLRRTCTLSERTIVTLRQVLYLVHRGYRCPHDTCPGHAIVYRSAAADALALPGFTFGLDVLIRAGTLRLEKHRTLDEIHWDLLEHLGALGVSMSRREVLYLSSEKVPSLGTKAEITQPELRAEARLDSPNGRVGERGVSAFLLDPVLQRRFPLSPDRWSGH